MQFRCLTVELSAALKTVSKIVGAKSSLPIMSGIMLSAESGKVSATTYDLETVISVQLDADVMEPGKALLPSKVFINMVRNLSGEETEIDSNQKLFTTVKSDVAEYALQGWLLEDYPALPVLCDPKRVALPANVLQSMLERTKFAISKCSDKPIQTGCLLESNGTSLTMVSTDGHRMALFRHPGGCGQNISMVIPGKALAEVEKSLKGQDEVEMHFDERYVAFRIGNHQICTRQLKGDFLQYEDVIPTSIISTAVVSAREMLKSVKRMNLLASNAEKYPLKLTVKDHTVHISCTTAEGRVSDKISCTLTGQPWEAGFNSRYLMDVLRAAGDEEIKLEFSKNNAPVRVTSVSNDQYLFLVLPVRLKAA